MPTPNEATVKAVLQRNDRDIRCREAIEQAWAHCKGLADRAWWRRKSTTAAMMWEHSIAFLVEALEGDVGAKVIAHHDTTSFIFDDTVVLRLKRAGLTLISSNYPTQLANLFHAHTRDLFGFDGHHRVEIVHVLNRFQTAIDWIGVVARDKKDLLWEFELRRGGAAVIPFPSTERLSPAADTVLRLAKKDDERKDAEEK